MTIQPTGYSALQAAQTKFDFAAADIAKNGPTPENAVDLLTARNQFYCRRQSDPRSGRDFPEPAQPVALSLPLSELC